MKQDLTHLKPGERIAIPVHARWHSRGPQVSHEVYTVTRCTPTQLVATQEDRLSVEIRVHAATGRVVGRDYTYVVHATPELLAQHAREKDMERRHRIALQRVDDLLDKVPHQLALTTEQLEALADAWTKIKEMKASHDQ